MTDIQHRFRVPHPLVLLTGCILLASMASYVLPAGEFERSIDEETGKIIKQIPEEEFLRLTNRISDFNKSILDQTV